MDTILFGGPVFTGLDDQLEDGLSILVQGERIAAIAPHDQILRMTASALGIDVQGRTILPGLIDAHRHIVSHSQYEITPEMIVTGAVEGVRNANDALLTGITSVRDPGCRHSGIFTMKRLIDSGFVAGPTIYPAGPNPTGSAAPNSWRNRYVNGPWEMKHAVRELKRDGSHWIKLVVSVAVREAAWKRWDMYLSPIEIQAAVEEAEAVGLKVSGHVEGLRAAQIVVEAGFHAIEHGTVIDGRLADAMAERGVFYVPTLLAFSTPSEQEDERLRPCEQEAFELYAAEHSRSFGRALAAGVKIVAGTDIYGVFPLDCLVRELELMIHNGMPHASAIKAATATGAALLERTEECGCLAPGMAADVIAVDGNPLKDIGALRNVKLVFKRGKEVISQDMKHLTLTGGV